MLKWFEKNIRISWAITLLLAITIFYISSLSSKLIGAKGTNINAFFYHLLIFFLFALFLSISIVKGKNKNFLLIAINIAIIYAIADEIHQFFVQGRHLSLKDIFIDSVGILLASTIYLASLEYRKK